MSDRTSSGLTQAIYGLVVFVSAGCALVLEIVAGRLLAPYVGMSLYSWTAIIAVVLAGLSAGHWIGGRLADSDASAQTGAVRTGYALLAAAVASLAVLVLLRMLAGPLLDGGLGALGGIIALTSALFFLPSLFAGIVSPLVTKLAIDAEPLRTGAILGRMFALGALGSIVGTLLAGYVLISWIGSNGAVLSVAAVYTGLGLLMLRTRKVQAGVALGLILVALAPLAALGTRLNAFASPCAVESDYYCLRVVDFSPQSGRPSAVLVLDHLGHGINDRDEPRLLYSPYLQLTDMLVGERFGRDALEAFYIGGGAYTLPRAWQAGNRDNRQLVAEIDPAVTALARERLWFTPDDGIEVVHKDARVAMRALPAEPRFHVIFGDAFHDITVPAHLVTREFHQEISKRLRQDGFYFVNVIESRDDPQFLLALLNTLSRDFAHAEAWLDTRERGARVTYLVVASQSPLQRTSIQAGGMSGAFVRAYSAGDVEVQNALVLSDDFAPVDRLMAHILLRPKLNER